MARLMAMAMAMTMAEPMAMAELRSDVMGEVLQFWPVVNRPDVNRPDVNPEHEYWQLSTGERVPRPRTSYEYIDLVKRVFDSRTFEQICASIVHRPTYEELDSSSKMIVDAYHEFAR